MKSLFNIDYIQLTNESEQFVLHVGGWYVPQDSNAGIHLVINGEETAVVCKKIQREDVVGTLKTRPVTADVGFDLTASVSRACDITDLELYATDGTRKVSLIRYGQKEMQELLESRLFQYHVDVMETCVPDGKKGYRIKGWAVLYDVEDELFLQICSKDGTVVTDHAEWSKRPELVACGMIDERYVTCGFCIEYPSEVEGAYMRVTTAKKQLDKKISLAPYRKDRKRRQYKKTLKSVKRSMNAKGMRELWRCVNRHGWSGIAVRNQELAVADADGMHYQEWFAKHRVTEETLQKQREHMFGYMPKISILVPTYRTPICFLEEMLDSVLAQSYGNWQLCIADGSQGDKKLERVLAKYQKKDARIVYKILEENEGISGNTNQALALADGDFIGLLDHDDYLEPDALYEVVQALQDEKTDIVYTDEDKVTGELMIHTDPNFKPDFSIDLLRSHNYITHFFCARKTIVDEVGGFHTQFDGAQDYDLILRCIEKSTKITHVPKILYHWRMHSLSTAGNSESKMYCYDAGKQALEEHLKRQNIQAKVENIGLWGAYHVTYDTPGNPLVSIIVPNKDHVEDLDLCIRSMIEKSSYRNFEIVIVENNSTNPETFAYYENIQKEFECVKVVCWEREFNYSAINNFGVKHAAGEYILLLNNDTELLEPNSLGDMLGICMRSDVGIVGAKLLFADDTVQHAGIVIGFGGFAGHVFSGMDRKEYGYMNRLYVNCNYSAVTAACLMTKRTVFDEVGGLTENFAVALNDVDYCLKVREKNYMVVYDAFTLWYHYESKSRGYEDTPEKQERFKQEITKFRNRWGKVLEEGDPYYNPNFPVELAPFTLETADLT